MGKYIDWIAWFVKDNPFTVLVGLAIAWLAFHQFVDAKPPKQWRRPRGK